MSAYQTSIMLGAYDSNFGEIRVWVPLADGRRVFISRCEWHIPGGPWAWVIPGEAAQFEHTAGNVIASVLREVQPVETTDPRLARANPDRVRG